MAKKKGSEGMFEMIGCCVSWNGAIHAIAGVGLGFLIAGYLSVSDIITWGWVLLGLGVLGHFLGWTKCRKCGL